MSAKQINTVHYIVSKLAYPKNWLTQKNWFKKLTQPISLQYESLPTIIKGPQCEKDVPIQKTFPPCYSYLSVCVCKLRQKWVN